jgi:hypothetical protein
MPELSLYAWEHVYHSCLISVYDELFYQNQKFKCSYDDFVLYCYNHSSHVRPSIAFD